MIHLIGTRHDLQHTGEPSLGELMEVEQTRKKFKAYLREKALERKPSLIGEEQSQEGFDRLQKFNDLLQERDQLPTQTIVKSTVKSVADSLNIEHRLCDADEWTREKLGIPDRSPEGLTLEEKKKQFRPREEYWLDQIRDRLGSTIIFVCGAEHVESFGCLLNSEGIETAVLHSDLCGG